MFISKTVNVKLIKIIYLFIDIVLFIFIKFHVHIIQSHSVKNFNKTELFRAIYFKLYKYLYFEIYDYFYSIRI